MADEDDHYRPSRRRLLRTGAACLPALAAGCSLLPGGSEGTPTAPETVSGSYREFQYDAANTGRADASGPTGNVGRVWKFSEYERDPAYTIGTPLVDGGTLYVGEAGTVDGDDTETTVYALDAVTGEVQWRNTVGETNVIKGGATSDGVVLQYVSPTVHAFDAETGDQLWSFSENLHGGPTVADGTAYARRLNGVESTTLYAMDVADGRERWSFDLSVGGPPSPRPPAVADGVVYVAGQRLYALDAADGTELWNVETNGGLSAVPTVVDDRVLLDAGERSVEARSTEDGRQLWRTDVPISGQSTGPTVRSPAVADGRAFVTTAWHVSALDTGSGERQWDTEVRGSDPPVVAGDTVYVSGLSSLTALDAESGDTRWNYTTDATSGSGSHTAVVLDDIAYLPSGALHALSGPGK